MIYLLLGKDDFSKKEFLADLQAKQGFGAPEYFYEWSEQGILNAIGNAGLFASKKMLVIYNQIGKFDFEQFVEKGKSSQDVIIFIEEGLDKRKTETKKILQNKNIKIVEFDLPEGAELRKWVEARAKQIGVKFQRQALDLFLQKIGADADPGELLYNLWQVQSELAKFKTYAGAGEAAKEITVADIEMLVSENLAENVFKITNAIADKNKKLAISQLVDYMDRLMSGDEKSKVISLSGIIAEQFRGILVIQSLLSKRTPDAEILKLTGYSSGRLFIYKKIAANFEQRKIYEALGKLELLDQEIKTSTGPASLQFFMIVNSVMN